MNVHNVHWNEPIPESCRAGAVTIGNFDGVHRGHQALLSELRRQANVVSGPATATTFDPPPSALLRPSAIPAALTTLADRTKLMLQHGAQEVLVLKTTLELLQKTPQEFFDGVIRRGLAARALVPGFNFAFGHNREGNVQMLKNLCHDANILCFPVPPSTVDGQLVSSSRIRAQLHAGNVSSAARLLGRPHRITGVVASGQSRGQGLGFPTANLKDVATLVPGDGVYAVRAHVGEAVWPGAANLGPNPTFGDETRKVEVHLIGFSGDLYGTTLSVDFVQRLRDTRKFQSPQELVAQLHADIAAARRVGENEANNKVFPLSGAD